MILEPLYHWAPATRREQITREGLRPYSATMFHHADAARYPYICLGGTPSQAWRYSGGAHETLLDEHGPFDLWQVRIPRTAELELRPQFGPDVAEVRIRTAIPADCVWLVATRTGVGVIEPEPEGTLLLRVDRADARYMRRALRELGSKRGKELDKLLRQAGVRL